MLVHGCLKKPSASEVPALFVMGGDLKKQTKAQIQNVKNWINQILKLHQMKFTWLNIRVTT